MQKKYSTTKKKKKVLLVNIAATSAGGCDVLLLSKSQRNGQTFVNVSKSRDSKVQNLHSALRTFGSQT